MDKQVLAALLSQGGKLVSQLMQLHSSPVIAPDLPQVDMDPAPELPPEQSIKQPSQTAPSFTPITTDETVLYQRREIAKELILLEGHLQQGCKINSRACDCCLVPGTKIYGNPGPATIEEPTGGAITHRGRVRAVTEVFERHYEGDLVSLSIGYTSFPLLLTPEHEVLVARSVRRKQRDIWRKVGISEDSLEWVPARALTDRDFIAFPRLTRVVDREDISIEMAELLGWHVAEGSVSGTRVTFSLGKQETANIRRVQELIVKLFGVMPKCYEKPTLVHVCYTNHAQVGLFKEFGQGARQKRIPEWLLYLPHAKQRAFLMSAIAGDGSRQKYQYVYTTTSETLAYQLRLLLFRLGILHSLSARTIGDSLIDGRKISPNGLRYDIHIAGDAARSLGLSCGRRTTGNHGWVTDNYAFLPIKKTKLMPYKGQVRNIGVDGDESYVTAHGALHNCEKHPLKIEGLAQEAAGMTADPVYSKLADWTRTIATVTSEEAAASGQYDDEYPKLAMKAREFRKAIMPDMEVQHGQPPSEDDQV